MNVTEVGLEGVNWIHLAHGKDRWRDLVNTILNEDDCLLGRCAVQSRRN
jgi:hypothetical protein